MSNANALFAKYVTLNTNDPNRVKLEKQLYKANMMDFFRNVVEKADRFATIKILSDTTARIHANGVEWYVQMSPHRYGHPPSIFFDLYTAGQKIHVRIIYKEGEYQTHLESFYTEHQKVQGTPP
jgi:hypothetical protein